MFLVVVRLTKSKIRSMTWQTINREYHDVAPNFLQLVDLILTISATSAEAERGFSELKLLKTDNRNCLAMSSLNTLLRIRLLSPVVEAFDPGAAIEHYNKALKRRKSAPMTKVMEELVGVESDEDDDPELDIPLATLLTDVLKDQACGETADTEATDGNDEEAKNTEADSDSEDMDIPLSCLATKQKDIYTDQSADVETNEVDTDSDVVK